MKDKMVKKKTNNQQKSIAEAVGYKSLVSNEKVNFLLGLIMLLMAGVLLVAMGSYINTGAADQSILENMKSQEWMNTEQIFSNYCGSLGSLFSYSVMTLGFGFPAFLLPVFVGLVGLRLMDVCRINLWKYFLYMILAMVWLSIALSKFLAPLMENFFFNPGGNHGLYCVQQLENMIGPPGLIALLLFAALAFLTYLSAETITFIRKALNPLK